MADLWLPGATIDPGANADYNSGHTTMQFAVAHATVGSDSRGIARRGFFNWLVHQSESREGGCTQYAESNAKTWHAGGPFDANPYGPGIEFERNVIGAPGPDGLSEFEPLTPNQYAWGRRIIEHLAEWGIPAVLYDGLPGGGQHWRGWENHHDLDPANRSDGLTRAEWARLTVTSPVPSPAPKELPPMPFVILTAGTAPTLITEDEAYEIADPGSMATVACNADQRTYIINDVRAKYAQKHD